MARRRRSIDPGNAKRAFWFATYEGGMTGKLFVDLLKQLMYRRKKPLHLVVDGLPVHKKAVVKEYVTNSEGCLTLHFLANYVKGEKLQEHGHEQLQKISENKKLVRSRQRYFERPCQNDIK